MSDERIVVDGISGWVRLADGELVFRRVEPGDVFCQYDLGGEGTWWRLVRPFVLDTEKGRLSALLGAIGRGDLEIIGPCMEDR